MIYICCKCCFYFGEMKLNGCSLSPDGMAMENFILVLMQMMRYQK